jgi:hypothetical protein
VSVFWPADVIDEVAKLVAECGQHLVFVLHRFYGTAVRNATTTDKKTHHPKTV